MTDQTDEQDRLTRLDVAKVIAIVQGRNWRPERILERDLGQCGLTRAERRAMIRNLKREGTSE